MIIENQADVTKAVLSELDRERQIRASAKSCPPLFAICTISPAR